MPEKIRGLREQGNADLVDRDRVKNADGSVSTVRSMSFGDNHGNEVLIPTAADGTIYSDDDAIDRYNATGEHLGKFDSPDNATAYAIRLHNEQAAQEMALTHGRAGSYLQQNRPKQAAQTADGAQMRKDNPQAQRRAAVDDVPRAKAAARAVMAQPQRNETVMELDENNNDVTPYRLSAEHQAQLKAAVQRAKNAADAWAREQTVKQLHYALQQPGGLTGAGLALDTVAAVKRATAAMLPAKRDPVMLQREFSNDADKEEYLQRIRQAQENVKK